MNSRGRNLLDRLWLGGLRLCFMSIKVLFEKMLWKNAIITAAKINAFGGEQKRRDRFIFFFTSKKRKSKVNENF